MPSSEAEWRDYLKRFYRTNDELLDFLRNLEPRIELVERCNTLSTNLREWFSVASEVRHAATRCSGLVKEDRMKGFTGARKAILEGRFPGACDLSGYHLYMDKDSARRGLEFLHGYAYALHKELSFHFGYQPAYTNSPTR